MSFNPAIMRQSRENAFALLFAWSFTQDDVAELIGFAEECDLRLEPFAHELLTASVENVGEIDALIRRYSKGWRIGRLSAVTLAILRQSFCELAFLTPKKPIPVGATINEAVELAKKYASEDEASFINGILGNYDKVRSGALPEPPPPVEEDALREENEKAEPARESADSAPVEEPAAISEPESSPDDIELVGDIEIEV